MSHFTYYDNDGNQCVVTIKISSNQAMRLVSVIDSNKNVIRTITEFYEKEVNEDGKINIFLKKITKTFENNICINVSMADNELMQYSQSGNRINC